MPESQHLHHDITRLTSALGAAVRTLGGSHTYQVCQRLGIAAQQLRAGALARGRTAFAAQIAELAPDDL